MAYYSVVSHGEHDRNCRYDFKNRAEEVIRDSRGMVVQDGDVYELRLPEPDTVERPDRLPPSFSGRPQARLHVSPSKHVLTQSLGSAARIVRLLHDFDDDPEAARRFRVRYAGRQISWARFCRSSRETTSIASFLSKLPARPHPLALHGTVGTVAPASHGNTYQLRDDQAGYLDHTDGRRRLNVTVRSKNADAFAQVGAGDRWLGYGHWRLWIAPRVPVVEIQLWVDGPWSLSTWRD